MTKKLLYGWNLSKTNGKKPCSVERVQRASISLWASFNKNTKISQCTT